MSLFGLIFICSSNGILSRFLVILFGSRVLSDWCFVVFSWMPFCSMFFVDSLLMPTREVVAPQEMETARKVSKAGKNHRKYKHKIIRILVNQNKKTVTLEKTIIEEPLKLLSTKSRKHLQTNIIATAVKKKKKHRKPTENHEKIENHSKTSQKHPGKNILINRPLKAPENPSKTTIINKIMRV